MTDSVGPWPSLPLGALADSMCLGKMLDKNKNRGRLQPYLRNVNVRWLGFDLSDLKEMRFEDGEEERYGLQPGDLVVCEGGEPGRAAVWNGLVGNARIQKALHRVRFRREEYDPRFGMYFLYYGSGCELFTRHFTGSTIKHLTGEALARVPFPLPPLAEQQRIVSKLDELLSDLDAGVAALERARANLKKYRAAVLKAAVTGDLTADWRAANPNAEPAAKLLDRILAERRRKWEADQQAKYVTAGKTPPKGWQDKYRQSPAPDLTALPELPSAWCWVSFEQCAFEVTVGHVGPMKDRYIEEGTPFLRSQNVRPLRFDREGLKYIPSDFHHQLSKSKLFGGELLVVRSGNIGEACVYPVDEPEANCADLVITRLGPGVLPEFAAIFVNSPFGRFLVGGRRTGSALSHFNVGAMETSPFPLPPEDEQRAIVAEVEQQLSVMAATENYIAASLKRAARLRQSILKEAFAGRLVPQDPSDEPAAVLLDRVRQARAANGPAAVARPRGRKKAAPTETAE